MTFWDFFAQHKLHGYTVLCIVHVTVLMACGRLGGRR